MNLIFRLIAVLWGSLWTPKRAPLDPSVLSFRVLPNDLDPNWHMNNGRYLTIMDLGRLDMTIHSGLMRAVLRNRWMPVLGAATIRYHRPLAPFQRYTLTTYIVAWDEKWIYMEQLFESNGKRAASALVKALIRGKDRSIPTAEVMRTVGVDLLSPPLPDHLRAWVAADEALGANTPR
jgi:acyl-CoA thioesterase FadM